MRIHNNCSVSVVVNDGLVVHELVWRVSGWTGLTVHRLLWLKMLECAPLRSPPILMRVRGRSPDSFLEEFPEGALPNLSNQNTTASIRISEESNEKDDVQGWLAHQNLRIFLEHKFQSDYILQLADPVSLIESEHLLHNCDSAPENFKHTWYAGSIAKKLWKSFQKFQKIY